MVGSPVCIAVGCERKVWGDWNATFTTSGASGLQATKFASYTSGTLGRTCYYRLRSDKGWHARKETLSSL